MEYQDHPVSVEKKVTPDQPHSYQVPQDPRETKEKKGTLFKDHLELEAKGVRVGFKAFQGFKDRPALVFLVSVVFKDYLVPVVSLEIPCVDHQGFVETEVREVYVGNLVKILPYLVLGVRGEYRVLVGYLALHPANSEVLWTDSIDWRPS